jgi:hypothetical protein
MAVSFFLRQSEGMLDVDIMQDKEENKNGRTQ